MADPIACTDGCGRTVPDMDAANAQAWHLLQITGRLRCPACARELAEINAARDEALQEVGP